MLHDIAQRLAGDLGDMGDSLGAEPTTSLAHNFEVDLQKGIQPQI